MIKHLRLIDANASLCDDYWHPAHITRTGLGPLADRGLAFDWIEHADDWSAERLNDYPVVILTKSNHVSNTDQRPWMSETVQMALLDYVRRGNSLLAIHFGTAGYDQLPVLRGLLGGVFISHPPQCPVTVHPQPEHPLTHAAGRLDSP